MLKPNTNYKKSIELSFVIVLTLLVFIFYFWQRADRSGNLNNTYQIPVITMVEIPRTVHKIKRMPRPLTPSIIVASDEIDMLEETEIMFIDDNTAVNILEGEGEVGLPSMMPRQVVEVMPEEFSKEVSGLITLSLNIGTHGRIIGHKVVRNTTNRKDTLEKILLAVYKTQWQPAILNGQPIEFWVEKTYTIN